VILKDGNTEEKAMKLKEKMVARYVVPGSTEIGGKRTRDGDGTRRRAGVENEGIEEVR